MEIAKWYLAHVPPVCVGGVACIALSASSDSRTLDLVEEWAPKSVVIGDFTDSLLLTQPLLLYATTWDDWGVLSARSQVSSDRLAAWMMATCDALTKVSFCVLEALLRLREECYREGGQAADSRVLQGQPEDLPVQPFFERHRESLENELGLHRVNRLQTLLSDVSILPYSSD
jgi:hypothetical protein